MTHILIFFFLKTCFDVPFYIIHVYIYIYMSGGQNYLLLAMDMTKAGGPLSVVKVFTQI